MKTTGNGRIHRNVARFETFLLTPLSFIVPLMAIACFFQRAWMIGLLLLVDWFCIAVIGQSLHKDKSVDELSRGGLTQQINIKPDAEMSLDEAHVLARAMLYTSLLLGGTVGIVLSHHGCRWFVSVPIAIGCFYITPIGFFLSAKTNQPKPARSPRHKLLCFVAGLVLATGSAYALSFAADFLFGGLAGVYPPTAYLPVFTWSAISTVLILAAFALNGLIRWFAIPFIVFGSMGVLGGMASTHLRDYMVAGVMFLVAFIVWRISAPARLPKAAEESPNAPHSQNLEISQLPHTHFNHGSNLTDNYGTHEDHSDERKAEVYGLFPMDRTIQTRLLDACRFMLTRGTPAQVRDLEYLIYALQRMPSTTPGVWGGVALATRHGESAAYRGFEFNPDGFFLTIGESVNFGCGTDHGSQTVLEVGTRAMRDIYDGSDFTEWLNMFCEQAADEGTDMEIYCDAKESVNLADNTAGVPWEENPLLDEW